MSKRKSIPKMTPPPLSPIEDLLDPRPEKPKVVEAEIPQVAKTEKPIVEKTVKQPDEKSKCTFYLPTSLAERIDMAHAQARVYTRGSRYKASKSELIEAALSYALDNFDQFAAESDVVIRLATLLNSETE